ncbi:MAG: divergent polysaccharide deacetylase family protein [Candidatus Marinimicrobia bacterium]|nr:divergent polysaccharide deacetylase family protein [Candidatus Neomarinimicrobiota bacterium]
MKKLNYSILLNIILIAIIIVMAIVMIRTDRPKIVEAVKDKTIPSDEEVAKVEETISHGTIVLIIDDFGYRNDEISDGFLALNAPITCAVIPGHRNSSSFAKKAIKAGKEVIIHMPMESHTDSPGEDDFTLKTSMTSNELEHRVQQSYANLPEAIGMNNHQGSKATENGRVMRILGLTLKDLGKFFIDSRTTANSIGEKTMTELGVKTRRRNVFLDNEFDPALIHDQLIELAEKSDRWGVAVGIGHAKQATLSVLQNDIPELKKAGYTFEFASKVVR